MTRPPTKHDLSPITVYRVVGVEVVICDLLEEHERKLVVRKYLGPVVTWVQHDNGYGTDSVPVRLDAQGRRYAARYPIDYFGSTTWFCTQLGRHFDTRPPRQMHRILVPADIVMRPVLEVVGG